MKSLIPSRPELIEGRELLGAVDEGIELLGTLEDGNELLGTLDEGTELLGRLDDGAELLGLLEDGAELLGKEVGLPVNAEQVTCKKSDPAQFVRVVVLVAVLPAQVVDEKRRTVYELSAPHEI